MLSRAYMWHTDFVQFFLLIRNHMEAFGAFKLKSIMFIKIFSKHKLWKLINTIGNLETTADEVRLANELKREYFCPEQ